MIENVITYFALPLTTLSLLLIVIRILKGPSVEDRIVGLDLLTIVAIAFIALYAMLTKVVHFLDVGLILAILAFLGTVAFSYFIERKSKK